MMLGDLGVNVIKVETPEGGDDSRGWGLLIDVERPVLGTIHLPGPPLRLFRTSGAEWHQQHTPPPLLG